MRLSKAFLYRIRSLSRELLPKALTICLVVFTGDTIGDDVTSMADSKDLLSSLPIELTTGVNFKIPPRPGGHVLDTAHFLSSELLQKLDDALSQESRESGVDIYLLTVPSVQKNTLDPFTRRVSESWTKGLFGATLVFDDGTGRVAIERSDEVAKRFYEFELSQLLKETNSSAKRPKLSREGLEYTAIGVKNALHELKMRANREDRNSRLTRWAFAIVGLLAVFVGMIEYARRRPPTESERKNDEAESSDKPGS